MGDQSSQGLLSKNDKGNAHEVRIPLQDADLFNDKKKLGFLKRMTSLTDKYPSNGLIYSDALMKAVSKNDAKECETILKDTHFHPNGHEDSYNFHPVLLAAQKGHHDILKLLLDHGADVNVQPKKENKTSTALHYALEQRSVDCCNLLLARPDIRVDVCDRLGNLPLHSAASAGLEEVARRLVEAGNGVNDRNKKKQTPLHLACMKGHAKVTELLLQEGALWDLKDNNFYNALHFAAFYGKTACCRLLVENAGGRKEEALGKRNKDGATPLLLAAKKGHSDCCRILLDGSDADATDKKGNTALHLAVSISFVKTVEVLLQKRPNLQAANQDGNTATHKAAMQWNVECLRLLVEAAGGANPGVNKAGDTVVHAAAANTRPEPLKYLLGLDAFRALINEQNKRGRTPLHAALRAKNSESALELISSGADVTIVDTKEMLPLHSAARGGGDLIEVCRALLSGAARVALINQRDSRRATPLHYAVTEGSVDCCKLLLTKGADMAATDSNGYTPFHNAAIVGNLEALRLFTKKGHGHINMAMDATGDTCLHLAAREGNYDCCDFLLRNMKRDSVLEVNVEEKTALDQAFAKGRFRQDENDQAFAAGRFRQDENDQVFYLILMNTPFPDVSKRNENYNLEQFYPFQSTLHEYMHEALGTGRRIVQKAIVESEWWESGFSSRFCRSAPCPNLKQLTRCDAELALKVYDKCIEPLATGNGARFNFSLFEDTHYVPVLEYHPDLKRESAFTANGKFNGEKALPYETRTEHPLQVAVKEEALPLMQHPLTKAFMRRKWTSYVRRLLLLSVGFEFLLVGLLAVYLSFVGNTSLLKKMNVTMSAACESDELHNVMEEEIKRMKPHVLVLFAFLVLFTIIAFAGEVFFLFKGRHAELSHQAQQASAGSCAVAVRSCKSIFGVVSTMRIFRIVGLIIFLFPAYSCVYDIYIKEVLQWQVGIVVLLVSWFNLIHSLNEIPSLSVFMPVTSRFTKSFLKVFFFLVLLVFIFAFVFHLLLAGHPAFDSIPVAFIKTIVWGLGDLGYDDTFLDDDSPILYPVMTNVLFVLLVTVISGFIVNLVIAQPTDHLQVFRDKALFHKAKSRIELVLKMDVVFDFIGRKHLVEFYDDYGASGVLIRRGQKEVCEDKSPPPHASPDEGLKADLKLLLEKLDKIEKQLFSEANRKR